MRNITIFTVLNGYVVQADCQCIVFDDRKKLIAELDRYLQSPETVEQEYKERAVNGYGKEKAHINQLPRAENPIDEAACEPARPRPDLARALRSPF